MMGSILLHRIITVGMFDGDLCQYVTIHNLYSATVEIRLCTACVRVSESAQVAISVTLFGRMSISVFVCTCSHTNVCECVFVCECA